jgi:O-methyltransferase domain
MNNLSPTAEIPPPLQLIDALGGMMSARALQVAAELGLADHLKDGARSCAELASLVGAHPPSLYRLLRLLASRGTFTETAPGVFAQTATSELLRSDIPGSMRDYARMQGAAWRWQAWGDLEGSVRTGGPAVDRILGQNLFEYFAEKNPSAGEVFSRAMAGVSVATDAAVLAAYDFSSAKTIADVGGAHGSLLASILAANPTARGVLFDLPLSIQQAPAYLAQTGVSDRITLVAGDFFQSVPSADTHVLRIVLHDWADEQCVAILRSCRRAIEPDGKLLVIEQVLPPGNTPSFGKLIDLEMLVCAYGRERTESEFRGIFGAAGFELTRVIPTPSYFSILEGVPC